MVTGLVSPLLAPKRRACRLALARGSSNDPGAVGANRSNFHYGLVPRGRSALLANSGQTFVYRPPTRSEGVDLSFSQTIVPYQVDDLRDLPLIERKRRLARATRQGQAASIQFVEHLTGDRPTVFDHVCRMGLEGIVSKDGRPIAAGRRRCGSSRKTRRARRCAGSARRSGNTKARFSRLINGCACPAS